jgi:hypothetical protein
VKTIKRWPPEYSSRCLSEPHTLRPLRARVRGRTASTTRMELHVALPMSEDIPPPDKQCRICLDGPDDALGRLIRPCLCRGSISVSNTPAAPPALLDSLSSTSTYGVCIAGERHPPRAPRSSSVPSATTAITLLGPERSA